MMKPLALGVGLVITALLAALLLTWQLNRLASFGYPLWYELLAIEAHIAHYGPQNRYRPRFAETTRGEHYRLFEALTQAVHRGGADLEQLRYRDAQGRAIATLLRPPEIGHLEDVARLVARLLPVGWLGLALWGALTLLVWRQRWPLPSLRRVMLTLGGGALVAAGGVAIVGPVRLFYHLHEWIFPPDHPWFFYYQDSLMTTLLKAPDLFIAIAAQLSLCSALLLALLLRLSWRVSALRRSR